MVRRGHRGRIEENGGRRVARRCRFDEEACHAGWGKDEKTVFFFQRHDRRVNKAD